MHDDFIAGSDYIINGIAPGGQQEAILGVVWGAELHPGDQALLGNAARLLGQVEESGARGVVFYEVKFCEPELFDLPMLRAGLSDAGIRSLVIEIDLNEGLSGQALTRLEAFLETIA